MGRPFGFNANFSTGGTKRSKTPLGWNTSQKPPQEQPLRTGVGDGVGHGDGAGVGDLSYTSFELSNFASEVRSATFDG